jgi:molybdopterin converting factor small subunit
MFSVLRNVAGEDQVILELKEGGTVRYAINELAHLYASAFKDKTGKNLVETLNQELYMSVDGKTIDLPVDMDVQLHEGSVIMVFQPVSGG